MLNRIFPLLNKLVPAGMAAKGLEKVDPRFGKFIQGALASGYSIDSIMDFLKDKSGMESENFEKSNLEQGMRQGNLQPHEKASYEQIRQSEVPGKALQSAATIGGAALGGVGALRGAGMGLSAFSGMLGDQSEDQQQPTSPQQANQQLSPSGFPVKLKSQQPEQSQQPQEQVQNPFDMIASIDQSLAEYIKKLIDNGSSPEQAAAIAKTSSKYERAVRLMEKNTKENFVDFMTRLFGQSKGSQSQGQQPQQMQQPQQSQQQNGQGGDAALMAALDKILKM